MKLNMTEEKRGERICGECSHILVQGRIWILQRLRQAADRGLVPLVLEVAALNRRRFNCRRAGCWVHFYDEACSLWEEDERLARLKLDLSPEGPAASPSPWKHPGRPPIYPQG